MSAQSIINELCALWGNTSEIKQKIQSSLDTLKSITGSSDELALVLLLQQNDLNVERSINMYFTNPAPAPTPGSDPPVPKPKPRNPAPKRPSVFRDASGVNPPKKRKRPLPDFGRPIRKPPKKRRVSSNFFDDPFDSDEDDELLRLLGGSSSPERKRKKKNPPEEDVVQQILNRQKSRVQSNPAKPMPVWNPAKRNVDLKHVKSMGAEGSRQCIGRICIKIRPQMNLPLRRIKNSIFTPRCIDLAVHTYKCEISDRDKEIVQELITASSNQVVDVKLHFECDVRTLKIYCSIWLIRNARALMRMDFPKTLERMHPNLRDSFPSIDDSRLGSLTLENLLNYCCRYRSHPSEELRPDEYSGPPDMGLEVKMFPYQKQAVNWMIRREKSELGLFEELFTTVPTMNQFTRTKWFYSRPLDCFSFEQAQVVRGGILCEEMGLGKTIEFLALCNANPAEEPLPAVYPEYRGKDKKKHWMYPSRATLVIAPPSLIGQWEIEIQERCKDSPVIVKYYGKRSHDPGDYVNVDFVLTTYRILTNEHGDPDYKPKPPKPKRDANGRIVPAKARKPRKPKKHTLHHIYWHRIVLDESHYVKSMAAVQGKACCRLKGKYRWCLTGTPFNTSLKDLQGQLKFLGVGDPLSKAKWWQDQEKLFQQSNRDGIRPLLHVLRASIMRHRKGQEFNGGSMIRLPEKSEEKIALRFTPDEKAMYERCWKIAKAEYDMYKHSLNHHYFKVKSALLFPRQVCSGIAVDLADLENKENKAMLKKSASVAHVPMGNIGVAKERAYAEDDDECPICMDVFEEPLQTPCRHMFCSECIRASLERNPTCPTCRKDVKPAQLKRPPPKPKEKEDEDFAMPLSQVEGSFKFGTKINYLLIELAELKRKNPDDKVLVFTSFNDQILALQKQFQKEKLTFRCLLGSMSMEKRAKELQAFKNDPKCQIFLMSIKSGAVGITLTAANHIYLMEPLQNPALYAQALNRVHRIGQKKKVFIKTLVMENSVEERIWNVAQSLMKDNSKKNLKDKDAKLSTIHLKMLYEEAELS